MTHSLEFYDLNSRNIKLNVNLTNEELNSVSQVFSIIFLSYDSILINDHFKISNIDSAGIVKDRFYLKSLVDIHISIDISHIIRT